ncbi:hypothetical protein AUCHE_24_00570 [Austwickia chelonae NBRC 105200]|uniref:Mycothiol-dependent maleylpyruvate isomerase metal-binding domain-containing protein n=2 Tax=Austwickia TaxID=1184606 RepID=K6WC31_9MICO|nr:hypothetical protein AUCHE_24_00570 [Austwickia chelonae NBRC 105200]
MHPAAPEDLHGLVEAFAGTAQAVVDLTFALSEEDAAAPTPCPGWTIKDQVSHVVSLEAALIGRPDPVVDVPERDYLRNSIGRAMENGVEFRRARTVGDIVTELQHTLAARLGRLRDGGLTEDTEVEGIGGRPTTLADLLRLRIFDVWCHEQDIRDALGRPGNLDSPAAAVTVARILDALPEIVVQKVGLEPGRVLMVELTGPVVARSGVRVEKVDDGEICGHLMFAGSHDETGPIPAIGRTISLQMSTDVFTRRAAGRRSAEDSVYTVLGDEDVARRFMECLTITP